MNADLKRRVRDALACYASTLHRETITATDSEVRELKARELAHVEALEREVRGTTQEGELTPADLLEEAYEQFTGVFAVRYPFVSDDQHFMVPQDAAEKFTQEMERGVAAFRAALAQPSRRP